MKENLQNTYLLEYTATACQRSQQLADAVKYACDIACDIMDHCNDSAAAVWNCAGARCMDAKNAKSLKAIVYKCINDLIALQGIVNAPDVKEFFITVNFTSNGSCRATYNDNTGTRLVGAWCRGGGYNKESAAVADVLNNSNIQKLLLNFYENRNVSGNYFGYNNGRDLFGYGAYIDDNNGVPRFMTGGVGMESIEIILNNLGFKRVSYMSQKNLVQYMYRK